jgi:acetyl esterase/lipase
MTDENEFIQQLKNSVYRPLPNPQRAEDISILSEIPYSIKVGYRTLHLNFYSTAGDDSIKPLVIWIHGGAFLFGSRKFPPPFLTVENTFYKIVRSGFNLATIDYRFSGEARWPAQLEDAFDAITWLQDRAEELHIDPSKMAIWGESAGAHIAVNAGIRFNNEPRRGRNGQALKPMIFCSWTRKLFRAMNNLTTMPTQQSLCLLARRFNPFQSWWPMRIR